MIAKLICWMFGHEWVLMPYKNGPNGWFYERETCQRCQACREMLVASKIG